MSMASKVVDIRTQLEAYKELNIAPKDVLKHIEDIVGG